MLGGIYENKGGKGAPYCVKFKGVFRRFWSEKEAERFLTGLRYKCDEGTFDPRDYKKENPLGFENLSTKWLERKRGLKSFGHIKKHVEYAQLYFANMNVKKIGFGEIDDFLQQLPEELSNKTKSNIKASLHSFWVWVSDREGIPVPKFPEIKFTLGWRNVITKDTQQEIIEEVKRISQRVNPKIWIGIMWLSRYYAIRPVEMLHIKEGDFDFEAGGVNVKYNKEEKPKFVPMLPEDLELVKSFPTPISKDLYFFRHGKTKGVHERARGSFGRKYLYRWWKRACANLGIEDIDLYGGTRHSTVRALRKMRTPEEIRKGSMHSTNKAFDRYFQIEMDDVRDIYRDTSGDTKVIPKKGQTLKPNPLISK